MSKTEGVLFVAATLGFMIGLPVILECRDDRYRDRRAREHCHDITASAILNCGNAECERRARAALEVCLRGIEEPRDLEDQP